MRTPVEPANAPGCAVRIVVCAIAVAFALDTAAAQQGRPGPEREPSGRVGIGLRGDLASRFRASDLNRDGAIGRAEAIRLQAVRFRQIDRNADDAVDLSEFSAMPAGARGAIDPKTWLSSRRRQFAWIDSDGDGRIVMPEFERIAVQGFEASDADRNGLVTAKELAASVGRMAAQVRVRGALHGLDQVDGDGDGAIDEAEFIGAQAARFARSDEDRNNALSPDEFLQAMGARSPVPFESLDVDRDGRIGRAEFNAAGNALFSRMDRNGDRRLTPEEIMRGAR